MKTTQHNFFLAFSIFGFVFGFLFFGVNQASAKVTIEARPATLYASVPFQIPIVISATESVNALEGEIIIPAGVKVSGLSDGGSVVSFWIEKPELKNNRIRFSGIIPGGVKGSNLILFTIRGVAEETRNFSFRAENLTALANDGKGGSVPITYTEKTFQVLPLGPNTQIPLVEKDITPPSTFFIQIGRDESLYEGKSFAVFETTDKESGISHYELAHSFWPLERSEKKLSWQKTENPLILSENFWPKYIYIRAVDFEGNTKVAILSPQKSDFKYLGFFLLVMIIAISAKRILRAGRFFL